MRIGLAEGAERFGRSRTVPGTFSGPQERYLAPFLDPWHLFWTRASQINGKQDWASRTVPGTFLDFGTFSGLSARKCHSYLDTFSRPHGLIGAHRTPLPVSRGGRRCAVRNPKRAEYPRVIKPAACGKDRTASDQARVMNGNPGAEHDWNVPFSVLLRMSPLL